MALAIFDIPRKKSLSFLLSLILVFVISNTALAQTTSFTYQGKLSDTGTPANGNYDFQFKLFDTATVGTGTQQGGMVAVSNVTVTNGVFVAQLDFGVCATCFSGANRFLEIALKPSAGSTFTTLSPRQQITATPYALKSLNATAADGLSVACVNCVTGSQIASVSGSAVTGTIPLASVPAGSGNYIQNTSSPQATSNFNISGTGTAGSFNATTQYNINGQRVLSNAGTNNLFAGAGAGSVTTASNNSFVGASAGLMNTTGNNNAFFGESSGKSNTTGQGNSFFGEMSGASNTTTGGNSFFGSSAGSSNTGSSNSFFGASAGINNSTASNNAFFGAGAGFFNTTSPGNSFFGAQAGFVSTGSSNSFFGAFAGSSNTTASNNSFFGNSAGLNNTTGFGNSFFGGIAGHSNTTGVSNSFFGYGAGSLNTASSNSFFGHLTGGSNTSGFGNSFFGEAAGANNTTGVDNVFVGFSSGLGNSTGSYNTLIGVGANAASDLINASAIGAQAQVAQSNSMVLGGIENINGAIGDTNIGIGTTAPMNPFDVNGVGAAPGGVGGFAEVTAHFRQRTSGIHSAVSVDALSGQDAILYLAENGGAVWGIRNDSDQGGKFQIRFHGGAVNNPLFTLLSTGEVGIGTTSPADRLQVTGDVRVGTGTTGCVKDADGTIIAGTCSSDARLKRDITPFQNLLDQLVRLQPVHFYWKTTEHPDKAFGESRSFGLIAQDVERVLPELVTEDDQGFKAVRYNKLPLLLLQAVKELKTANDVLSHENKELKQRLADQEARLRRLEARLGK